MATRVWEVINAGIMADRPAATEDNVGFLYYASDEGEGTLFRSNGTTWDNVADKGAVGPEGPEGPQGPQGDTGPAGADGEGVPVGGTTGQVLSKASNADFDTVWITLAVAVYGILQMASLYAIGDVDNAENLVVPAITYTLTTEVV